MKQRIINRLLLIFTLAFFHTVSCFGQFLIDDIDPEFHRKHYNSLPSVEVADRELQSRKSFQDFLEKSKEIIVSHELEDYVGLRLIHQHFNLGQEQVMVESFDVHNNTPSLMTQPVDLSTAREKGAVPSGFIFYEKQQLVFEFSTDQFVKDGLKKLQEKPGFLNHMRQVIENYNLQSLMSVALLKKEGLVAEEGQIYLEKSFEPSLSVVQLVSRSENLPANICTSWGFSGPKTVGCYYGDWYCDRSSGGHEKRRYHREYP